MCVRSPRDTGRGQKLTRRRSTDHDQKRIKPYDFRLPANIQGQLTMIDALHDASEFEANFSASHERFQLADVAGFAAPEIGAAIRNGDLAARLTTQRNRRL